MKTLSQLIKEELPDVIIDHQRSNPEDEPYVAVEIDKLVEVLERTPFMFMTLRDIDTLAELAYSHTVFYDIGHDDLDKHDLDKPQKKPGHTYNRDIIYAVLLTYAAHCCAADGLDNAVSLFRERRDLLKNNENLENNTVSLSAIDGIKDTLRSLNLNIRNCAEALAHSGIELYAEGYKSVGGRKVPVDNDALVTNSGAVRLYDFGSVCNNSAIKCFYNITEMPTGQ